jgi:hypothetical protein
MKYIKLFTERYQADIIDTLTELKEYFTKDGVHRIYDT